MEASKNLSMFVPNFFDEDKTFPKRSLWQCIRLDTGSDSIWQRFSKKFPSMDPNDLNDKLLGAGEGTTWNKAYPRVEFDPEVSSLLCLHASQRHSTELVGVLFLYMVDISYYFVHTGIKLTAVEDFVKPKEDTCTDSRCLPYPYILPFLMELFSTKSI